MAMQSLMLALIVTSPKKYLKGLVEFLRCQRRSVKPSGAAALIVPGGYGDFKASQKAKAAPDTCDIADLSTDDLSDDSGHTDVSTDCVLTASRAGGSLPHADKNSDSVCRSANNPPGSVLGLRNLNTVTLAPPPGLEHPRARLGAAKTSPTTGERSLRQRHFSTRSSTTVAKPQTKGNYREPAFANRATGHQEVIGAKNDGDVTVLTDLVDKLSPQEFATFKCMLEQKALSSPTAEASQQTFGAPSQGLAKPKISDVASEINNALASATGITRSAKASSSPKLGESGPATGHRHVGGRQMPWSTPGREVRPSVSRKDAKQASRAPAHDVPAGSMRDFLFELSSIENSRVITVRRVGRLGFDASNKLQEYFSKFGRVERVMASTILKNGGLRPASVGFVVMSKSDEAEAARSHAFPHIVEGEEIGVESFQSHSIDGTN